MRKNRGVLIKAVFFILSAIYCQIVYADDYKEYAKQIREDVWLWDKPEFKNYTVSEKYKDESAVILAHHYEISAIRKNKFRAGSIFTFQPSKETYYYNTERVMIKINDKSALDSHSELKYKEEETTSGFHVNNKYKTIVGVRIIKPNGDIREINTEEAVSVTQGKRDEENYKKLAISDLQIGDIIDYFIHNEARVETDGIPTLFFSLASIYPTLSYSIKCEVGKKLTTEYRSLNGAPDFEVKEGEDGTKVLWVEKKNIAKFADDFWVSPMRQYPMIRLFLLDNSMKMDMWGATRIAVKGSRPSGLYKNISFDTILFEAQNYLATRVSLAVMSSAVKQVKKSIDIYKKNHPNLSQEELAEYIARILDFRWTANYYDFPTALAYLLNENKIENKLGLVTNRDGVRKEEVGQVFDFGNIVTANNNSQIFNSPSLFYNQIKPEFEGEEILANNVSVGSSKLKFLGHYQNVKIPITKADSNKSKMNMEVRFSEKDPLSLDISEQIKLSGHLRQQARMLIRYDIWDSTMRSELGIHTTQVEDMQADRKDRKYVENYLAKMEQQKKEWGDNFKEDIKNRYEKDVKELYEYTLLSPGLTKSSPDVEYKVKFSMDGFVKKAGTNYILDAGKLIGAHMLLKDEDRKRTLDIYMPFARSFEYDIQIRIPSGYAIENYETFNRHIENEVGLFVSEASVQGELLRITVKKYYTHSFEPLKNWDKLLEVIDAANVLYSQSIILKKIN